MDVDEIPPRGLIHASNFKGFHEFRGKNRARLSTPPCASSILTPVSLMGGSVATGLTSERGGVGLASHTVARSGGG